METTGYCENCPNPIECYQTGKCWPPVANEKADDRLGATACCPLPGATGYIDHMRERNRREGIESEAYRAPLKIAGFVTAGWLEGQARDAEANGHALVEKGLACAADAWFSLANAYRIEASILISDNACREALPPQVLDA